MRDSIVYASLTALVFVLLAGGCGSDPCKKGATDCASDRVIRTCIPSQDGDSTQWFASDCAEGSSCTTGTGDASVEGSGEVAACMGTCQEGQSECVGDMAARYCVDGRSWLLEPCAGGQLCVDGACRFADGGLEVCEPQARQCASADTEKVCDRSGSKWIEESCLKGEQCLVDRCAPDPDASCDVPSQCLDNKTALRCLGEDKGFEMVECAGDTYCQAGQCWGSVCALGSVCGDGNQVVTCLDGESLEITQCAVNEACKQDGDVASCISKVCDPGEAVCGDPRDDKVDPTKFYTQCVSGDGTASGTPQWVTGECTDLLVCDPVAAALGQPCQQECTPGAQTCMQDPVLSISDGFATCQDDGTWGEVTSCNDGGLRKACAIKPNFDASVLPEAICVEPVCAYIFENGITDGGSCKGAKLQQCDDNGKLQSAKECEVGICRALSTERQGDGRVPGACDTEIECEEAEQRCLVDDLIPTSLYQSCENGFFSPRLETCSNDDTCLDYVDPAGLRSIVCGADCTPGEKRCNISDQVETCNAKGKWGNATSCSVGACATLGNSPGKRDAACILECVPGEKVCTGVTQVASDGSLGYLQQAKCGSDGLLGSATDCATDTLCRISSTGDNVGCVECVGPNVLGGNAGEIMDTRCDPMDGSKVQECADDNTWAASRTCASGKTCRVAGATCGSCTVTGSAYALSVCTESALALTQVCGPCTVDPGTGPVDVATCTTSELSLLGTTCLLQFGNDTTNDATDGGNGYTSWGGLTCCEGATGATGYGEFLLTSAGDCSTRGGVTSTSNASDCCGEALVPPVGGATFAYCSE